MTESERFPFESALRDLAGAMNKTLDGHGLRGFWAVLSGEPLESLLRACEEISADPEAKWPTAGALLARSKALRESRQIRGTGTVAQHQEAADNKQAAAFLKAGRPFVFMAQTDADGRPTGGLFPMLLGPNTLEKYRKCCDRLPEWIATRSARGDVPPCLACHQLEAVRNCDVAKITACGRAVLGFALDPAELAQRAGRPM